VPVYHGKRGHPLLFSARYSQEILTRYDGEGLRGLLRAHPEDIFELPAPSDSVLSDMDYPQDYLRLQP
jgi:molybdenum cofactor cytidylyltransferase